MPLHLTTVLTTNSTPQQFMRGLAPRHASAVSGASRLGRLGASANPADHLAAVGAAHERVPLGEGAPFWYLPIVLPPEGRPPPEAPAALTRLATYAVPWPRHYSVTRPSHPRLPQTADSPPRTQVPGGRATRACIPPTTRGGSGARTASEVRPSVTWGPFLRPAPARPAYYLYPSLSIPPLCGDAALAPRHFFRRPRALRSLHLSDAALSGALSSTLSGTA